MKETRALLAEAEAEAEAESEAETRTNTNGNADAMMVRSSRRPQDARRRRLGLLESPRTPEAIQFMLTKTRQMMRN